jgi:Condensation domain/Phosphopantetheine attachment site
MARQPTAATGDASEDLTAAIAAVWQELYPDITVTAATDLLDDLGATELAATIMTDRVRQAVGRRVSLQTLYEHPTLGRYIDAARAAPALEASSDPQASGDGPPPPRAAVAPPGVYSDARGMQWPDDRSAINVLFVLEAVGSLDVPALRRAMTRLVDRHGTLRCGFGRSGSQIVYASCPVEIGETSCSADRFDQLCVDQVTQPFTLTAAPLWRANLVHSGERLYLVAVFNHLITDAASLAIFHRELAILYSDEVGEPREPLAGALQYGAFAAREQQLPTAALEWWRDTLDVEPPQWRPVPTDGPVWSRAESVELGDRGPRPLADTRGATPPTIVRAAIAASLIDDLAGGRVVLGDVQSRRDAGTRATLGWLTDYLPIPLHVAGGATAAQLITHVAEATAGARRRWPGSANPILRETAKALGRPPESLMHVHTNYIPVTSKAGWERGGHRVRFVPSPLRIGWDERMAGPTTGCALQFHVHVDRITSRVRTIYAEGPSDVWTREQLRERAQRVADTLDQMLHDPDWRL